LRDAILGKSQRFLLLLKGRFAPVELGLKIGGLIGIPLRIVKPGSIDWSGGFGRLGGRLRCRHRHILPDDGNQPARTELIHIVVRPDFLSLI
jgi:hypothetical protein